MDQGSRTLLELLERANISHSLHKVIPFIGEIVPDIDTVGPTIVMGSYSMRHIAKRKGWAPGCFDLGPLTYGDHVDHWGQHMLNADSVYCRFEDALPHLDRHGPNFIRPTVDSKFFAGGVFEYDEFADWWEKVVLLEEDTGNSLSKDTMVMIASPKNIQAEYRLWAIDGRIVTGSLYKRGGRVLYDALVEEDIFAFAQARVDEWQPHVAFVIDIARTSSGLKIVETNTLNAAGFYHGDVGKIVHALETLYVS